MPSFICVAANRDTIIRIINIIETLEIDIVTAFRNTLILLLCCKSFCLKFATSFGSKIAQVILGQMDVYHLPPLITLYFLDVLQELLQRPVAPGDFCLNLLEVGFIQGSHFKDTVNIAENIFKRAELVDQALIFEGCSCAISENLID